MKYLFGRQIPKDWKHIEKYPFSKLGFSAAGLPAEVTLPFPYNIRAYMDQSKGWINYGGKIIPQTQSCVAIAELWAHCINNLPKPIREKNPKVFKYDFNEHYNRARIMDGDPNNDPPNDLGTYLWAGMEVLRTFGARQVIRNISQMPTDGSKIQSYYWCKTIDEMRTALSLKRPIVFGFNWYENFMSPVEGGGKDWWIGQSVRWGNILGGHATCSRYYSDSREAFQLISWTYPYPLVWISYSSIKRLMNEYGEACVIIDDPRIA